MQKPHRQCSERDQSINRAGCLIIGLSGQSAARLSRLDFRTKLDGYRAIAIIDSTGKTRVWSHNQLPLEPKFPTVRDSVDQLNLPSTILDGEIVALDEDGVPRIQLLQQ